MTILIDSDVVLDLFVDREPHHTAAIQFFSYIDADPTGVRAVISPIAVANVSYVLTRLKNQTYAVRKLRELRALVSVVPTDQNVVDNALSLPGRDLEDALQYECAAENEIPAIVTRNRRDYPKGSVDIFLPDEFVSFHTALTSE